MATWKCAAWGMALAGACAPTNSSDGPLFIYTGGQSGAAMPPDGGATWPANTQYDASIGTPPPSPPPVGTWTADAAAPVVPVTAAPPVAPSGPSSVPSVMAPDAGPSVAAPPPNRGAQPALPAITGACPSFKTGTISAGGLGGISIQVGEKKASGGSLIFYWHGTGSSAGEVNVMMPAAVREAILAAGGIIVSPQSSLNTGGDCSGTSTFSKDDFKVADLIAACAVRDHNIDPRRIYTTGCSAGGLQAGCMASLRSSYIAAAVPNSGGLTFRQPLQDTRHVPAVMTMHGGPSDWVAVSFSQTSQTLDSQMKQAGGFVVNCDHGGGHCRAPAQLYSAGWEFMKAHPYGTLLSDNNNSPLTTTTSPHPSEVGGAQTWPPEGAWFASHRRSSEEADEGDAEARRGRPRGRA